MQLLRPACMLLACCAFLALFVVPASAYPSMSNYYRIAGRPYDSEEVMEFLNRLSKAVRMEPKADLRDEFNSINENVTSDKRGFDLGINRGYSGNLQAAHLMGLAAAGYSGGPGRRRRDTSSH